METGEPGALGVLVVPRVVVELNHEVSFATILPLPTVDPLVRGPIPKLEHATNRSVVGSNSIFSSTTFNYSNYGINDKFI
jgi:hypothetical protein